MKTKILLFVFFFMLSCASIVIGDTIHLKNGRSIEGLIKKQDEEKLELNVGFGTVTFRMKEIESVYRSSPEEIASIYKDWEAQRELEEVRAQVREKELQKARLRKQYEPKEVEYIQSAGHIVVEALINKKTKASLLLDTGSSTILLSNNIAKRLKIKEKEKQKVKVKMADGREVEAYFMVLDTVSVEGVKAKDVAAVVLLDASQMDIQDGLLGMSFLNRFNFQIDTVDKKLILKKRRGAPH